MAQTTKKSAHILVLTFLVLGCSQTIETEIGAVFSEACPETEDFQTPAARDACAAALVSNLTLTHVMPDVLSWGAEDENLPLERALEDSHVTDFNPRVLRAMYFSVFIYGGDIRVEEAGDYRVLAVPVRFRNELPAGEYPYPFWHSPKKWQSYEQTPELHFFLRDSKMVGALRSNQLDAARPHKERVWDGEWTVEGVEPRVSLYSYLFSPNNPEVPALDVAYRTLAGSLRTSMCFTCHSPDNGGGAKHLELLNYPNQALSGRHDIVRMIEAGLMPPGGLSDEARVDILGEAREFAVRGDAAFAHER